MMSSARLMSEEEEIVYEIVKEYLQKKALSSLEEMIDFVSHRLKSGESFNRKGILKIIKSLIKKNLIMPGSKLVREDILAVPKRVEILDYITAMPGTNMKEIMDFNGIGSSHAIWHLTYLKKFQFIRSVKFGNQKAYFKANFEEKYDEVFFYLRNTKVKKIIKLLREQKSANPTEMSEKLNIHYNTIRKYINTLKTFNLLKENDGGYKKEYLLNQDTFDVIQNVIDNLK